MHTYTYFMDVSACVCMFSVNISFYPCFCHLTSGIFFVQRHVCVVSVNVNASISLIVNVNVSVNDRLNVCLHKWMNNKMFRLTKWRQRQRPQLDANEDEDTRQSFIHPSIHSSMQDTMVFTCFSTGIFCKDFTSKAWHIGLVIIAVACIFLLLLVGVVVLLVVWVNVSSLFPSALALHGGTCFIYCTDNTCIHVQYVWMFLGL